MEIDDKTAKSIKAAIDYLYKNENGRVLIEFLEEAAGKYQPMYDSSSPTSVAIAAGRIEVIQTLRNLNRLTKEEIVSYYKENN